MPEVTRVLGLGGGVGGAYVIGAFDIVTNPEMALFIPLIAAMGGNVGVQSSAIVVQGLATSSINTSNIMSRLTKELGVGIRIARDFSETRSRRVE